ncbi:MAG: peptidase S8 [Flavobacteriia bacterium]|nr:peptidase S8 [Flavobacteriia bacterium]
MKITKTLCFFVAWSLSFSFLAQAIPGTLNWYNGIGTGMYTDVAYKKILNKKKATPVIVAVIDSGVDLEHEDLQGKIWTNTKEIPNNNKDDDGNGYVDDVHGWNFLGNAKGENQEKARLEKARIVKKYRDKFEGIDPQSLAYDPIQEMFQNAKNSLDEDVAQYEEYRGMIGKGVFDKETEEYLKDQLYYNLNPDYDDRSLIGDNHGVADAAVIMSVRTVPNGDENDKDVALAIRYAVDNGAKVINMSFGKSFSPYHDKVQEAIAYAASKDVLMIHAAGNDAADIDYTENFPKKPIFDYQDSTLRKMFLNIGASTRNPGDMLVASFSNFGVSEVDVFAPGLEIYNSVPQSDYKNLQGTSMASPMVAGVAALLKSRFPQASMLEISDAITRTTQKYDELSDKCIKGGVVNVLNAATYLNNLYK